MKKQVKLQKNFMAPITHAHLTLGHFFLPILTLRLKLTLGLAKA